jgi:DNA-binding MarR family transcriptional regulator
MSAPESELDAPPWRRFESTLMATSKAIRREYDRQLADLGLRLTEALVIAVVDDHGPISQAALAQRLGIGRASVGQTIDHLVSRDLIVRAAHRSDRRVHQVVLTDSGRALAAHVIERDRALRNKMRRGLSKADRTELARMLLCVQTNLRAAEGASAAPTTGHAQRD